MASRESAPNLQPSSVLEEEEVEDENDIEIYRDNEVDLARKLVPYEAALDPDLKALASGHPSPIVETARQTHPQ